MLGKIVVEGWESLVLGLERWNFGILELGSEVVGRFSVFFSGSFQLGTCVTSLSLCSRPEVGRSEVDASD
jgi:hypothetical protein